MFIEKEDLYTVLEEYQLNEITRDETIIKQAILAAIGEVESYLSAKYDTDVVFAQTGAARNAVLLEYTKSLAVYYLIRLSNYDILYDKVKEYRNNAVEWLSRAAGITEGKSITPNLPLRKDSNGNVKTKLRMGSNTKFNHHFD